MKNTDKSILFDVGLTRPLMISDDLPQVFAVKTHLIRSGKRDLCEYTRDPGVRLVFWLKSSVCNSKKAGEREVYWHFQDDSMNDGNSLGEGNDYYLRFVRPVRKPKPPNVFRIIYKRTENMKRRMR